MSVDRTSASKPGAEWQAHLNASKPGWFDGSKEIPLTKFTGESVAAFKKSWDSRVGVLQKSVPSLEVSAFKERAASLFNQVVDHAQTFRQVPFTSSSATITKTEAHNKLQETDRRGDKALSDLSKSFARSTSSWTDRVDDAFKSPKDCYRLVTSTNAWDQTEVELVPVTHDAGVFDEAAQSLEQFFDVKLNDLLESVPQEERAEVRDVALKAFSKVKDAIAAEKLGALGNARNENVGGGQILRADLKAAVLKLHAATLTTILELNQACAKPNMLPQLVSGKNGISLLRPAPQLETLVLSGGGAKGIGNNAALAELQKFGALKGLERVVGTSAGALTAACLSSGVPPDQLNKMMGNEIKMDDLKLDVPNFNTIYPELDTAKTEGQYLQKAVLWGAAGGSNYSGQNALRVLDRLTAGSVADFLTKNTLDYNQLERDHVITPQERGRLEQLEKFTEADLTKTRSGKMVTFRDLQLLHKVAPHAFKELALTGWDTTNNQITYFDQNRTPDMPVALAGRISMSIPLYFQAAVHESVTYKDGGVMSNMPSEVVTNVDERTVSPSAQSAQLGETRARTMLMAFDDQGEAYTVLHKAGHPDAAFQKPESGLMVTMSSWITGSKTFGDNWAQDKLKTYAAGPNTHVVFHGDVGTFDLSASKEKQEIAKQMATIRTLEQIEARTNQAYAVKADSVADAVKLLSSREKEAILKAGPPNRTKFRTDVEYKNADNLYKALLNPRRKENEIEL
jgi:predicted acylesterase/phospholipase RssA